MREGFSYNVEYIALGCGLVANEVEGEDFWFRFAVEGDSVFVVDIKLQN